MAYMMFKIGDDYAEWGTSGTSLKTYYIDPIFKKMGYSGMSKDGFDETTIQNCLKASNPVLITGFCTLGGHGWVIDGLTEYVGYQIRPNAKPLYHCIGAGEVKTMVISVYMTGL